MKYLQVFFIFLLSFLFALLFVRKSQNNVCKTFPDYYTNRDENENCYYNSDYKLSVPEITIKLGYPSQTYNVTTEDGHILSVFRIPYSPYHSHGEEPRKPVFLQHGMAFNSHSFVNVGRKSLAFVLSDSGYDVWLGNFRGTKYSLNHLNLSNDNPKFWDFSGDELGAYDVPAQINLVRNVTDQKIIYLGYSLGSTTVFMYGSTFPQHTLETIKVIVGLTPAVYGSEVRLHFMLKYTISMLKTITQFLTNGEFFVKPSREMIEMMCLPYPFQMELCQLMDMITAGYNYDQNNPETLPITLQTMFDSTSMNIISHTYQICDTDAFQHFDRGTTENMLRYQSPLPPLYNLSKINVPVYLIGAANDLLTTVDNLKRLDQELPVETKVEDYHIIEDQNFNHMDVLIGRDAKSLVFDVIVKFLNKHF